MCVSILICFQDSSPTIQILCIALSFQLSSCCSGGKNWSTGYTKISYNSIITRQNAHFKKYQNQTHDAQIIAHRKTQIKAKVKYQSTYTRKDKIIRLTISSLGNDMEQLKLSNITTGNVKSISDWKSAWLRLLKLNINLQYKTKNALLDIHLRKIKILIHTNKCTGMFEAALFMI